MSGNYNLEQWVWSEADFGRMRWHDSTIHGFAFFPERFEMAFDLDYLLEWVLPVDKPTRCLFQVVPVTMVFENIHDFKISMSTRAIINIDEIFREHEEKRINPCTNAEYLEWTWRIECQEGTITLKSTGYKMYIKADPALQQEQRLQLDQRGGVNFARGKISEQLGAPSGNDPRNS